MATAAALDGFRPMHEAHAIEQLIVTVQFEAPLADAAIKSVIEIMGQFQDSLPGKNDIRGMGFQFGPNGVTPISQYTPEMPHGIIRTLTDGKGVVVKELRVDRQSLVFRTLNYTRWDNVWAETRGYFSKLLPTLENTNIAAYSLAYLDKFVWEGSRQTCRPERLLKQHSRYISPASFDANDLWHCHSGRFISANNQTKRLEVVDVDCVDEVDGTSINAEPTRVVRISTTLTDFLSQPGFPPVQLQANKSLEQLDIALTEQHNSLKQVFSAIVSDEIANLVGLNANAN